MTATEGRKHVNSQMTKSQAHDDAVDGLPPHSCHEMSTREVEQHHKVLVCDHIGEYIALGAHDGVGKVEQSLQLRQHQLR